MSKGPDDGSKSMLGLFDGENNLLDQQTEAEPDDLCQIFDVQGRGKIEQKQMHCGPTANSCQMECGKHGLSFADVNASLDGIIGLQQIGMDQCDQNFTAKFSRVQGMFMGSTEQQQQFQPEHVRYKTDISRDVIMQKPKSNMDYNKSSYELSQQPLRAQNTQAICTSSEWSHTQNSLNQQPQNYLNIHSSPQDQMSFQVNQIDQTQSGSHANETASTKPSYDALPPSTMQIGFSNPSFPVNIAMSGNVYAESCSHQPNSCMQRGNISQVFEEKPTIAQSSMIMSSYRMNQLHLRNVDQQFWPSDVHTCPSPAQERCSSYAVKTQTQTSITTPSPLLTPPDNSSLGSTVLSSLQQLEQTVSSCTVMELQPLMFQSSGSFQGSTTRQWQQELQDQFSNTSTFHSSISSSTLDRGRSMQPVSEISGIQKCMSAHIPVTINSYANEEVLIPGLQSSELRYQNKDTLPQTSSELQKQYFENLQTGSDLQNNQMIIINPQMQQQNLNQYQQNLQTQPENPQILQPIPQLQPWDPNQYQPNLQTQQQQHLDQYQQNTQVLPQNSQTLQQNLNQYQQNQQTHQQPILNQFSLSQQLDLNQYQQNPQTYHQNLGQYQQNPQVLPQNLQTQQQNLNQCQQNPQILQQNPQTQQQHLNQYQQNPQVLPQNVQTHQQNLNQYQQNPQVLPQNVQKHLQNLNQYQKNPQVLPQNPQTQQQNINQYQQNPQVFPQNPQIQQQNLSQYQQNLRTQQQNLNQYQQNPQVLPQNPQTQQQNINQYQQNPQVLPQNPQIQQQNLNQYQQNLQTQQQNVNQYQQNPQVLSQNPQIQHQNLNQYQQNLQSQQQNLNLYQQNPQVLPQNSQTQQHNLNQHQQNPQIYAQYPQTLQLQQLNQYQQTQQENLNQYQQNSQTHQQNPDQYQQNQQILQQNLQTQWQNLNQYQQNPQILQQRNCNQGEQNPQILQLQNCNHGEQNPQILQQLNCNQGKQNPQILQQQNCNQGKQNPQILQQQNCNQGKQNPQILQQQNCNQGKQNPQIFKENSNQIQQRPTQQEQHFQDSKRKLPIQQNRIIQQMKQRRMEATCSFQSIGINDQPMQNEMQTYYEVAELAAVNHPSDVDLDTVNHPSDVDLDTVNHPSDVDLDTGIATIKYITTKCHGSTSNSGWELAGKLREFITQNFQELPNLENVNVGDVCTNQEFNQFLKELSTIGYFAASDLKKCQELRQAGNEGLTSSGACIADSMNQMETTQMLEDDQEPIISQENKIDELKKLVELCKQDLTELDCITQKLTNEYSEIQYLCTEFKTYSKLMRSRKSQEDGQNTEKILTLINNKVKNNRWEPLMSKSCFCLCNIVKMLRVLEAWIFAKLTPVPAEMDTLYSELGAMFTTYFDCVQYVAQHIEKLQDSFLKTGVSSNICDKKDKLSKMKNQVLSIAWYFEKQPPTCFLTSEKKKDLSIRLFGLTLADIDVSNYKVYIFPQEEYENRFSDKYLYEDTPCLPIEECGSQAENRGVRVLIKKLGHNQNFQRMYKQGSAYCFEQLQRIIIQINLRANTGAANLECLSLPFAVRTGSDQLWECEGAVKWYCFSANDLYTPPFRPGRTMKIDQILCMLQAIIFTQDQNKYFSSNEIDSLRLMLQTLCTSQDGTITLRQFVKENMPVQGNDQLKKVHKFACFTWFMAAANSSLFLKDCNMSGRYVFLTNAQCIAKIGTVPKGSALIRVSWNEIECITSKTPYANLVVCTYSDTQMKPMRVAVKALKLKPASLPSYLQLYKDVNDETVIKTILPLQIPLKELLVPNANDDEQVNVNDYRTRFKNKPGDILLLEQRFEDMHIYHKDNMLS